MVCPASSGTAGREIRLHDRAASGWMGADVRAAFLESQQCLAVAEGGTPVVTRSSGAWDLQSGREGQDQLSAGSAYDHLGIGSRP
jgi:hypothetical protein